MPIDESKLRRYENKELIPYRSLPQLLRQLPTGKRGALYITHVHQMERCEQIAIEAGMKPICVWSLNHEKPMTQEQLEARDYILTNECVPPQYDLFIFKKSCETSINLRGHMDYMIAHSREEETLIQARGRYRDDLVDFNQDMTSIVGWLKTQGILVRTCTSFGLPPQFLRLGVKTETENDMLISALKEGLAKYNAR